MNQATANRQNLETNPNLKVLELDIENLTNSFLKSEFYKSYLLSDSFAESLKLFLQAKHKMNLNPEELKSARKIFMCEVARIYESNSQ